MVKRLTFIVLLVWSSLGFPLGGVGDVVTDPGSYAYYAEQIKAATEQINALNKQIKNLENLIQIQRVMEGGITAVAGDLIGVYNNAVDLVKATKRLKKTTDELPSELQNRYYKEIEGSKDTLEGFEKMEKFLAKNYRNPLSGDYDPLKYDLFRNMVEQSALKDILNNTSQSLSMTGERVETIDNLANKIDETQNVKDSADLSNRLLTEILIVLHEMNVTMNQFSQIQALGKYHDAEGAQAAYEAVKDRTEDQKGVFTPPPWMQEGIDEAENNPVLKRRFNKLNFKGSKNGE